MTDGDNDKNPNHLEGQTSPYLLQHLYNPVDWYPWGDEALERARREQTPIFLSVGYAACHWCHVMERESFEDPEIAAYLNEHFVSIKVDREERPDVDEIYMNAVQLMTGAGGWPMTVFLTPDLRPFFGGTYFPPESRYGRISFPDLLRRVHEAWSERRSEVDQSATQLTEQLRRIAEGQVDARGERTVGRTEISRAVAELTQRFDPSWGGFGGAPKFPPDGGLGILLREHARTGEAVPLQMAEKTLQGMAAGGMYDHVGGGFARYSVDEKWLVPHFEKMLYNQALLVPLYLDAWLLTRNPLYRRVVEETLDFVARELCDPGGGFYSSLDADSEGVEGKFYVWTPEEVAEVLGPEDGRFFCELYNITSRGNFEGRSISNLSGSTAGRRWIEDSTDDEALARRLPPMRAELLRAREQRIRPGTDDKILTSWNGLMISAFSRAYQLLGRERDLRSAKRAADFLLTHLTDGARLLVSYRAGQARLDAYLDEHAFFGRGLLDLYEAGFEVRYLAASRQLALRLIERFGDSERGGFYFTSRDHTDLLTRNRSLHDGALPSGAGVATELLLRLAMHFDDDHFRGAALRTLAAYRPMVAQMPSAYSALLRASELAEGPTRQVALVGDPEKPATQALLAVVRKRFRPQLAVGLKRRDTDDEELALLSGKIAIDGQPTAYVCRDYACASPTNDPEELERQLDS